MCPMTPCIVGDLHCKSTNLKMNHDIGDVNDEAEYCASVDESGSPSGGNDTS